MKNYYALAIAAAVAVSGSAMDAGTVKSRLRMARHQPVEKSVDKTVGSGKTSFKVLRKLDEAPGKWVARNSIMYFPLGDDEWEADTRLQTTYDASGFLVKEVEEDYIEETCTVTTYTYGDNGLDYVALSQSGDAIDDVVNSVRLDRTYDSRIPSLITKSYRYQWNGSDWTMAANCYHRVVERDGAGNVTAVRYYTLYQGNFEEVQRVVMEYGADGNATAMSEYQLQYDANYNEVWVEGYSYRDMEWYETDGQLFNLDYIFEGANKVKSYKQYHEDEYVCAVEVTYKDGSDDFVCTATYDNGSMSVQDWTNMANGGFINDIKFMYFDEDEDAYVTDFGMYEYEEYDVLQNLLLGYAYEYYGDGMMLYNWEQATCELNADGLPTTYILRMFIEDEEDEEFRAPLRAGTLSEPPVAGLWEDEMKIEYSGFELLSGVESVSADGGDATVEFFSLDGRRVTDPANGIFIRKQGASVSKVVL